MKRFTALLLAVTLCLGLCPLTVSALSIGLDTTPKATYSGTCGDNLTWSLDTATGLLSITGTGDMTNYVPWNSYSGYIKTVSIAHGVTSIGDNAFCYCYALTSVTIPDSVTSIGVGAFCGCYDLTSITIGSGVTSIGTRAFEDCNALTSITIPDSVTSIGTRAFAYCYALTSITVDTENDYYCSDNGVLFNKDKTTLIQYPIGKEDSSYTIPDSVTGIGDYAFSQCTALTSITIPDSVTSIGVEAFCHCYALTSITIGSGVTSIGDYAFEGCDALTSVTIPDSVTSIGDWAFAYCYALTSITVDTENDYYCSDNGVLFNKDKTTLIQYPIGKGSNTYTIPDSVTSIGDWAFEGCNALTNVTIGNSVTSIGYNAFGGCTALTSITIGSGVTSIGDYAFSSCNALTSITIGSGVTSIGDCAFRYCRALTSITIPDSVTSIGTRAFYGCDALTSVTIPDSVTSIGVEAFYNTGYYNNASNWENGALYISNHLIKVESSTSGELIIKDGTVGIAARAFYDCDALTSVTIPDSVTSIGSYAFRDCNALTSVTIGNSVTSIGSYAFRDCNALTSVTIPDSVTSIGSYAFRDCNALTSITIPDSVTSIGDYAFYGCSFEVVRDMRSSRISAGIGALTVDELADLFPDEGVKVYTAAGAAKTSGKVGTGCTVEFTADGSTFTLTVVVKGDVSGDGEITASDYAQTLACAKGNLSLSGAKLEGANVAQAATTGITSTDYAQILAFAKGNLKKFTINI